jgi:DNA polymerase-1
MKTLYLVDASNMFYRAFFAIPPLTNNKGMPTNALYGFINMTMKLLKDCKPDYLVYCFDRKEETFRNEIYAEYKAHRDEMPDDLKPQIPYLKQLTTLLGLSQLDAEGFEADDVIGTLAMLGVKNKVQVVIVSGDKDFAQLVRPGVSLYDTMKDVRTDDDGVKAKFGIRPDQMIDYLAIVGDSSDNVPGVRGIGPKGAVKLLADYETLDGIYRHIDEIKGATQKKLIENKEVAFLSRKLCTIVSDVKLDVKFDDFKPKQVEQEPLRALLQDLGFNSLQKKFFSGETPATAPGAEKKISLEAPAAAEKPKAKKSGGGGGIQKWVDEEWTVADLAEKIEPYSEIWGLLSERGLYLGYKGKALKVPADDAEIGAAIARKNLRWKGYDLKQIFKALRLENPFVLWDGLLAAYVARPSSIEGFDGIFEQYCSRKLPEFCSPAEQLTAHQELEVLLREKLVLQEGESVYEKFDLPLVPVLAKLEVQGMRLDLEELKNQSKALNGDIVRLEKAIHQEAGETFNIGSPKQMGTVLFDKLKLPPGKKTKTGYSTDSEVLESLAGRHAIAKLILEWRELSKLKSTYVDALPALAVDGRVHTSLNQAATSTGRLSSLNPNLQNIPIRTERGRLIRKAFIADEGHCIISADYSQIELRILAHITGDEGLTKAFHADLDIHTATAAEVFEIPLDQVTSENRRIAKAVNFGIAYGQGAYGLADALGIERKTATDIIKRYFERFPGVKQYMETTIREGIEAGYVSTLFGRRRYIDELKSQNQMLRRAGERAAINAPIQGTAADLVKLAMIQVHQSLPVPLLLQVHDELLFECPVDDAKEMAADIQEITEKIYPMKVPLKVNVGIGPNWDDAH